MSKTIIVTGISGHADSNEIMAQKLSDHFNTAVVLETARRLMEDYKLKMGDSDMETLELFAKTKRDDIEYAISYANKIIFSDTDNFTTQVCADVYLVDISDEIKKYEHLCDLYLLLDVDVPWVDDNQKNLSHRRREMFRRFKLELDTRNINYVHVKGNYEERFE